MVIRMLALGIAAVALVACTGDGDDDQAATSAPAGLTAADAQTAEGAPLTDTVTVVGQGEASGEPDVVRATVGVEVTADSADRALETASARAADVIAALQDVGVAEEDIQTQEISLREERDRPPPEPGAQEPVAAPQIVAVNVLEVRIRAVDEAGAVLAAVGDAAGDVARIRGVRFELSEPEPLLETAREQAFADARSKAEQYASLADRELGALVSIREHGAVAGPSAPTRIEEADAASVPVQPGTQDVTVQLTAVWSLE